MQIPIVISGPRRVNYQDGIMICDIGNDDHDTLSAIQEWWDCNTN